MIQIFKGFDEQWPNSGGIPKLACKLKTAHIYTYPMTEVKVK